MRVRRPWFKPDILEHQSRQKQISVPRASRIREVPLPHAGGLHYKDIFSTVTVWRHVIQRSAHILEMQLFSNLLSPEVHIFSYVTCTKYGSQWLRCRRRESEATLLLRLLFRIPPEPWIIVSCECCVLSSIDVCVGLITRPGKSHRVRCVWVWSWSLGNEEALAH